MRSDCPSTAASNGTKATQASKPASILGKAAARASPLSTARPSRVASFGIRSGGSEQVFQRNNPGARWLAFKALEEIINIVPSFDQGYGAARELQLLSDAPFALEGPIHWRRLVEI